MSSQTERKQHRPLLDLLRHPQLGPRTVHVVPLTHVLENMRLVSSDVQSVVEDVLVEAFVEEEIQGGCEHWRLHEQRPHYWTSNNAGMPDPKKKDKAGNKTLSVETLGSAMTRLTALFEKIREEAGTVSPSAPETSTLAAKLRAYLVEHIHTADLRKIGRSSSSLQYVESWLTVPEQKRKPPMVLPEGIVRNPGGRIGQRALHEALTTTSSAPKLQQFNLRYGTWKQDAPATQIQMAKDLLFSASVYDNLKVLHLEADHGPLPDVLEMLRGCAPGLEELHLELYPAAKSEKERKEKSTLELFYQPISEALASKTKLRYVRLAEFKTSDFDSYRSSWQASDVPLYGKVLENLNKGGALTALNLGDHGSATATTELVMSLCDQLKEHIPHLKRFLFPWNCPVEALDYFVVLFGHQLEFLEISGLRDNEEEVINSLISRDGLSRDCQLDHSGLLYCCSYEPVLKFVQVFGGKMNEAAFRVESDAELAGLLRHCPRLTELTLLMSEHVPGSFSDNLGHIIGSACPDLLALGCYDVHWTGPLGNEPKVEKKIRDMTDTFLLNLAAGCHRLMELQFSSFHNVSVQGLFYACRHHWPHMQTVDAAVYEQKVGEDEEGKVYMSPTLNGSLFPKDNMLACVPTLEHCPHLQGISVLNQRASDELPWKAESRSLVRNHAPPPGGRQIHLVRSGSSKQRAIILRTESFPDLLTLYTLTS